MTDSPPDPGSGESESPFSSTVEGPNSPSWEGGGENVMGDDMSPSFALDMARLWVQQHQKASMLGAFGVGVLIGALLRD